MKKLLLNKISAFIIGGIIVGLSVFAFQVSAASENPQTVTICIKNSGFVYVVGQGFWAKDCGKKDRLITINTAGVPGPKGDKGDTGEVGPQGPKGDQGEQGTQGLQGIQGDKGEKGDIGLQGIQGEKGDKGDMGATGPKGDKGDSGQNALAGYAFAGNFTPFSMLGGELESSYHNVAGRSLNYSKVDSGSILKITYEDSFGVGLSTGIGACKWRLLMDGQPIGNAKFINGIPGISGINRRTQSLGWILPNVSVGNHTFQIQMARDNTWSVASCENGYETSEPIDNYLIVEELR